MDITFPYSETLFKLPFIVLAFIIFIVGKFVFQKAFPYHADKELTEKDNPAFGILMGSYLLGLAIALLSTATGYSGSTVEGLKSGAISIAVFGTLSIVLLCISVYIMDKVILNTFDIHVEISRDRNIGVAFVTGSICIASGLVIGGVMSGSSDGMKSAIRDMFIYWAVGQAFLIIGSKLLQVFTKFDDQELLKGSNKENEKQNIPVGLMWAGFLIAQGLIIKASLNGAGSNILAELKTTGVYILIGYIMLYVVTKIADTLLLPKAKMDKEIAEDHNPAAGIICAVSYITVALMLTAIIG